MHSLNDSSGHPEYTGTVYKKTIGSYTVHSDQRILECGISSRLRKRLIYPTADPHSLPHRVRAVQEIEHTDPIAVGDQVRFIDAQDGSGLIIEVLPRLSRLTRRTAVPMPGAHPFEQVIVANVDQVVPVFAAASPSPKWSLLDRYLVSAESLNLPSLIVINKADLAQAGSGELEDEIQAAVDLYRAIGYPLILTSTHTGLGLEELKQALVGKVSVLVGKSGVGKTSLLNAIQPDLGLRVNAVSQATGKGRHTTTHLEMFALEYGAGAIVDTPGVREFGPWDLSDDDLALFFPEMRALVGQCKFALDCTHNEEPGCAIRQAVMAGKIHPWRYRSLLRLKEEG